MPINDTEAKVVRSAIRYQRIRLIINAITVIAILIVGVALLGITVETRDLANTIEECNTPGQQCYEDEQARVEAAITEIVENQRIITAEGSVPSRTNVEFTVVNSENIKLICEALRIDDECQELPPLPPELEE